MQVHPAVAGDGPVQSHLVGGLNKLVDQPRGQDVLDPEPRLSGRDPQPDQQVALAGAGAPDQSYDPQNTLAQSLYASMGFVETGELADNETVARRQLK
jgi:hypothetical protein